MRNRLVAAIVLSLFLVPLFFQNCSQGGFKSSISSMDSGSNGTLSIPGDLTQPTSESQFINHQFGGHVSSFVNAVAPAACELIGDSPLPLVTHYPNLGDHEQANPGVAPVHFQPVYDYKNFGMPGPGHYIGNNFSTLSVNAGTPEGDGILPLLKKLCAKGLNKVKFVQGAHVIARAGDLAALVDANAAYFQVLHGIVYKNNLFTVVVPPAWKAATPNQLPTLFNGFYDLNQNLVSLEGRSLFEILSQTYTDKAVSGFGILWNGNGAIGSRTLDQPAFIELDEFLKIYLSDLGAANNKLVTFGISRGGATAFNVAAHPLVSMKTAFMFSANPPYRLRDVGELIGPTIPLLLTAPDWSVGFANSWYLSFRHPAGIPGREDYVGLSGVDSHMKALTGTTSNAALESDYNLITPAKIAKLKAAQTQMVLEIGSHDFIVPSVDQFKFYQDAIAAGLDVEVRRNYMSGHYGDNDSRDSRLLKAIESLVQSPYPSTLRFVTKGAVNSYVLQPNGQFNPMAFTGSPLTLEFPRYMVDEAPSHILATGNPGTVIYLLLQSGSHQFVETLKLNSQGIGKLLLDNLKYPAADYICSGIFVGDSNGTPAYKVNTISTSKEPRGIVMTSLIGQVIPTDINAGATLLRAFRGANDELAYVNPGVPNGSNYGLFQDGDLPSISDADLAVLQSILGAKPPTCTYTVSGSDPEPVGVSVTETIVCQNIVTGQIVKLIGTKGNAPQMFVIALTNNSFSQTTLNDGTPALAGAYVRHVEVLSATGAVLFKTPEVKRTLSALPPLTVACTYVVVGSKPLPVGETLQEMISCTNLPIGAVVKLVGSKDGAGQINVALSLVDGKFNSSFTNDGSPAVVGTYIRHLEVYSAAGVSLYMTGNVVQTILGPTCTHVATGKNPLPVNESVVEMMQCSNVPAGATFKIKTIKDGVPLVDTPFSLVGGRFSQTFTNTGVPDLVGSWRRHIEMYSSTGALLTSTLDFTFVFLTPSCSYTVTATEPVPAGGMAIETAVCSVLPTGAVVKLYGTVNGSEQVNQAISLVSGKYSQTYTNPGGATLLFRRRVEVYSPTSQLILATPYVEITFGP